MIRRDEPGVGLLHLWCPDPTEDLLVSLLTELFREHWREVTFGPLIHGIAWECQATEPPRIHFFDGYLTVEWGASHFHLCIGEHHGDPTSPTPEDLRTWRRAARAEFFRRINRDATPDTWGFRLFNGHDEQMITCLFPNPFVTHDHQFRSSPDWSKLRLWDELRARYLGLPSDPFDRTGRRMVYP